jgi:hypothetical protein
LLGSIACSTPSITHFLLISRFFATDPFFNSTITPTRRNFNATTGRLGTGTFRTADSAVVTASVENSVWLGPYRIKTNCSGNWIGGKNGGMPGIGAVGKDGGGAAAGYGATDPAA